MHFFVFCRKIVFKLIIWPNDVSEWKKHLKIDLETRSYDFLTKTHEKNPMSGNIRILAITSESDLNEPRQNFLNTIHCGAKFWAIFRLPASKSKNSKWNRVLRSRFEIRNDLGFFIRPIEKYWEFAEIKFSSVKMHSLNLLKKAKKNP